VHSHYTFSTKSPVILHSKSHIGKKQADYQEIRYGSSILYYSSSTRTAAVVPCGSDNLQECVSEELLMPPHHHMTVIQHQTIGGQIIATSLDIQLQSMYLPGYSLI
jgi:hypothetical protein